MKRIVHTIIKMSIASFVSIMIALAIGLDHAIASGILAVLSVQLTRKDSYLLAGKRISDAMLALALATILFVWLGYSVWVFSVFTVLFITLSFAFKINEGIVPSLVLASHLLLEGAFSVGVLVNAFLLLAIAVMVTLILNLIYPLKSQETLKKTSDEIDNILKDELFHLAKSLNDLSHKDASYKEHQALNTYLNQRLKEAELADRDILFDKDRQAMRYLRMRFAQMNRLDRLFELLLKIDEPHPYTSVLATYIESLKDDIGHANKATPQKEKLIALLNDFRQKPLPDTRQSFETRATLYQMMFELEGLLEEKISYHESIKKTSINEA